MEKLDRKDFLKLAGGTVAGAAVGTTLSGAPFLSMQWLLEWTQDQYSPPVGNERFANSIYGTYPGGSQVSVRMINNRAVKIGTSEEDAAAQVALQLLYHPERIKSPLKRTGKKGFGNYTEVSWEEALKDISSKINELTSGKNSSIAAIDSGDGGLSSMLMQRLINSAGSPNIYGEPSLKSLSENVVGLTQRVKGSISYDLENADCILSFGARIVEGWGNGADMNRAFNAWKAGGAKLVQIDSMNTRTASLADKWIPVKAGTESILALGIAYHLIKMGKRSRGVNFGKWSQIIINEYPPAKVSEITSVDPSKIQKLAVEFASAKRPLAVAGRGSCEISSSVAEIAAVQCLNSLAGSIGRKGGALVKQSPGLGALRAIAGKSKGLDDFMKNSKDTELLFINEANPVHKSVYGKGFVEKIKKIPMVVSIMPLINDTGMYSDYILPSLSALELVNMKGQTTVSPRYKSMYSGDIIIKIAKESRLKKAFPWNNYRDALKSAKADVIKPVTNFTFPVKLFKNYLSEVSGKIASSKEYPLTMIPFSLPAVGDGSNMAYPYVLKGIDDTILLKNTYRVQMNPETASKYDINGCSSVNITSKRGIIKRVGVHLTKTIPPDVVAVPLGFGQVANTKYAAGKGVNPKEIMSDDIDPVSGVADWWLTKVKIS